MTKDEKLEKAQRDHKYALVRIGELEKEMTKLRMQLRFVRQDLQIERGMRPRPQPYDHHY